MSLTIDEAVKVDPQELVPKDKFEVVKVLGKGAFGIVLYCRCKPLGNLDVAVKIRAIRPDVAERLYGYGRTPQESVMREGLLCKLSQKNPHMPTIFWADTIEDNIVYIVEELIQGETLDQYLKKNPSYKQICSVMEDTIEGLAMAHNEGIVHNDYKPSNIMVDTDWRGKIIDFNIFSLPGYKAFLSGSFPYRAPETFDTDYLPQPTTDIWAVGITLYQALTGELPFQSDITDWNNLSPEKIEHQKEWLRWRIRNQDVFPPQLINPEIGNDTAQLLEKALNKNPKERYQNAEQMQRNWFWLRHKYKAYAIAAALATAAVTLGTKI